VTSAHEGLSYNWRRNWLSSIRELAAIDWQRDLWGKSTNPHHSFVEYVESYINDLALEDGYSLALEHGLVSESEVEAVCETDRLIRSYNSPSSDFDHAAILSDAAWHRVTQAAEAARNRLLAIITDEDECRILLAMEPEYP